MRMLRRSGARATEHCTLPRQPLTGVAGQRLVQPQALVGRGQWTPALLLLLPPSNLAMQRARGSNDVELARLARQPAQLSFPLPPLLILLHWRPFRAVFMAWHSLLV